MTCLRPGESGWGVIRPLPQGRWSGEGGIGKKPGQNGVTEMFGFFSGDEARLGQGVCFGGAEGVSEPRALG